MGDGVGEKRQRRRRPEDHIVAQRGCEPRARLLAILAAGDHLGEQGVVVRPDLAAGGDPAVDPDAVRLPGQQHRAEVGAETLVGALGGDARLDGVAAAGDLVLGQRQRLAAGDAQLPFDEIEAGDRLGDRVLDLEPRVDLEEPWLVMVLFENELDGAEIVIADRLAEGDGAGQQFLAHGWREIRCGRFLDQLLVMALDRAVPLPEVDEIAVMIAGDLDFDMARPQHQLFDQQRRIAEGGLRSRAGRDRAPAAIPLRHELRACPCRRHRPMP